MPKKDFSEKICQERVGGLLLVIKLLEIANLCFNGPLILMCVSYI